MSVAAGVFVLVMGLIAWVGQSLAFLTPALAVRLGVLEAEEDMDPTFYVIEARAMALTDITLAWMLPTSAALMLIDHPIWPVLGLIASGVFAYFSLLVMLSRFYLNRDGKKIGGARAARTAYVFGTIWIVCAILMAGLASAELGA